MKKQTLKLGTLLVTLTIITTSCKQKEKYTPATEKKAQKTSLKQPPQ